MSLDINYYSFSPSRADAQWKNFKDDILAVRAAYALSNPDQEKIAVYELRYEEETSRFAVEREAEINNKYHESFRYFDERGFYIPGVGWWESEGVDKFGNKVHWSDEDKWDYMCMHWLLPKGFFPPTQDGTPHDQLDWETIEEVKKFKETAWKKFWERSSNLKLELGLTKEQVDAYERGPVLSGRQEDLYERGAAHYYLGTASAFDKEKLRANLKLIDLFYGSVMVDDFESAKLEETVLAGIVDGAGLTCEKSRYAGATIPTKSEWIRLYENLSRDLIDKIVKSSVFDPEEGWDPESVRYEALSLLKTVRPVVKDLKATGDAVFIRQYSGDWDNEPMSSEALLEERAAQHAKEFAGIIPPIL